MITGSRGHPPLLLSAATGILLTLSFPMPSLAFLAWAALVPLIFASVYREPPSAFALGFLSGAVWGAGSLYWTHVYHPAAALLIILILSLYPAFFSLLVNITARKLGRTSLLWSVPVIWCFLEYIRTLGFLGFPWNSLGYSQSRNLYLIQISEYTGVFGVSFLICLVNGGIAAALMNKPRHTASRAILAISLLPPVFLTVWGYGRYEHENIRSAKSEKITVAGLQPAIHPQTAWSACWVEILTRLEALSAEAAAESPLLIIFPETVISEDLNRAFRENPRVRRGIEAISESSGSYLLIGAHYTQHRRLYNSAYLKSPECEIVQRYDKIKLVPGGEYLPYFREKRPVGKLLNGAAGYTPGDDKTVFEAGGHEFSALICFEGIFGNLARQFVKKGAGFLVNITNDAWSLSRTSHYQHSSMAVFRSIENRVYLVRVGNTGITRTINPAGKTESRLEYWTRGFMVHDIAPRASRKTFYTLHGDIFSHINVCIFLLVAARAALPGKRRIRYRPGP